MLRHQCHTDQQQSIELNRYITVFLSTLALIFDPESSAVNNLPPLCQQKHANTEANNSLTLTVVLKRDAWIKAEAHMQVWRKLKDTFSALSL